MHFYKNIVLACSLVYITFCHSISRDAGGEKGEDTLPTAQNTHQYRIDIFQKDNYLIAIQDKNSQQRQDMSQDYVEPNHEQHTPNHDRNRRSTDYKYQVKKKDYYSSEGIPDPKHNSVHWFEGEKTAVVELLVVVDHSAFKQVLTKNNHDIEMTRNYLEKYYRLLVTLIDARYAQMEATDLHIKIRPADIVIQEDKRSSKWVDDISRDWRNEHGQLEKVVDPKELLDSFHEWLASNVQSLPEHDHAMAFIGYRMVRRGRNSPSSGMAYVNTICQTQSGYSCSVIQETWGFGNAGAATHELGHSLGATHDGLEENSECPAEQGYLMAPTSSPQDNYELNFFSFSSCSIKAFQKTIGSSQAECLHDTKAAQVDSDTELRPGEWITPNQQCQQVFGDQSGECRIRGLQEPEEICQRLWCARPMDDGRVSCSTRGGLHAVYGTTCGRNKICYNGLCVQESTIAREQEMEKSLMDSATKNLQHLRKESRKNNRERSRESNRNKNNMNTGVTRKNSGEQSDIEKSTTDRSRQNNPTETSAQRKSHSTHSGRRNNDRYTSILERYRNQNKYSQKLKEWYRTTTNRPTTTTSTPTTTTTIPTTTTTTTKASIDSKCTDTDERYCRSVVYSHASACDHQSIHDYCCFSCNFYG